MGHFGFFLGALFLALGGTSVVCGCHRSGAWPAHFGRSQAGEAAAGRKCLFGRLGSPDRPADHTAQADRARSKAARNFFRASPARTFLVALACTAKGLENNNLNASGYCLGRMV